MYSLPGTLNYFFGCLLDLLLTVKFRLTSSLGAETGSFENDY